MPKISEIKYADITVLDSHTLGYDSTLCVEGLYAIHEHIKTILNADKGFSEPPKVLNAFYCIGIFGCFRAMICLSSISVVIALTTGLWRMQRRITCALM